MVQAAHQNSAHPSPVLQCVTYSPVLLHRVSKSLCPAIITTGSKEQPTATEQGTAHKAQHSQKVQTMSAEMNKHQQPSPAYEGTHNAQAYSELCSLLFSIWARTVKSRPNYARTARGLLSNTHALYASQQACPTEYADSVRAVIARLQPSRNRAPQGATAPQ